MKTFKISAIVMAAALCAGAANAGPFILAGTDADDHGFATATANLEGWLFMQKSLESLAGSSSLVTTNKVVYSLGSDAATSAGDAAASAFSKSSLVGAGWSFVQISTLTDANLLTALTGGGIVMLDSGANNVFGGLTGAEESVLTSNAAALNSFLGAGGGLFSQAGEYGWLSALVPGLTVNSLQDQGLSLTGAGSAAFPGLTDADLSAGPYHANFTGVGAIPVLATGEFGALNVVIGASGGSITNPVPAVPEPSTYALLALGLGAISFTARRRKSS